MTSRVGISVLLLLLTFIGACAQRERGRFAAVAADAPTSATVVAAAPTVGRACFGAGAELGDDHVIDAAVSDELARVPGEDAIANATIDDEGLCIRVQGTPVRISSP